MAMSPTSVQILGLVQSDHITGGYRLMVSGPEAGTGRIDQYDCVIDSVVELALRKGQIDLADGDSLLITVERRRARGL